MEPAKSGRFTIVVGKFLAVEPKELTIFQGNLQKNAFGANYWT